MNNVSKTGHPRLWVAGLVFALVAVIAFVWLREGGRQIVPEQTPGPEASTREDAAARLLSRLESALERGTRADVARLAAPGEAAARAEITAMFDNVRALDLTGLSFRYVDANTSLGGETSFGADVALTWRIDGFDRNPSRMEVSFIFSDAGGEVSFLSARPPARTREPGSAADIGAPLWLLDELAVERSGRSLVMVVDDQRVQDFAASAERAAADVRRVLPRSRGRLVVEVPGSEDELEQITGAEPGAYRSIAAVTTTADGSLDPSSPSHIFVNPAVFNRLSRDGAQIVMSHEATHVATEAATSTMPVWLLEGFADYVALDGVDLPVSTTASQILAKVRRQGPPRVLPAAGEFDPTNKALGTSYEAAWLACRFIGAEYGENALVDLYTAVDRGQPLRQAFDTILDTDPRTFTTDWRDYLRRLAA